MDSRGDAKSKQSKARRALLGAAIRATVPRAATAGTHGYRLASAYNVGPGETKWVDTHLDAAALTGTVNTTVANSVFDPIVGGCLDRIPQGSGPNQRMGMKANYRGLSFKGSIYCAPQETVGSVKLHFAAEVFLAIVLDTQTNGAAMLASQVYDNPGATTTLNTHLHRNKAYEDRFKVLKTKRFRLTPGACTAGSFPAIPANTVAGMAPGQEYIPMHTSGVLTQFDMYVNLKGIQGSFDPAVTGGDIAQHRDNSIHVIAIVNHDDMEPRLSYNSRLTYTE